MSSLEETKPSSSCGIITKLLATVGGLAAMVVALGMVMQISSPKGRDCKAQGHGAVICAAGSLGFVDLEALAEKDRRIETLTGHVAAREAETASLATRIGEAEARLKDLDAAQATAKAAATEVERLRGEIGRRDGKIAELTEKLAATVKAPTVVPPVRPAPPPTAAPIPTAPPKPPKP